MHWAVVCSWGVDKLWICVCEPPPYLQGDAGEWKSSLRYSWFLNAKQLQPGGGLFYTPASRRTRSTLDQVPGDLCGSTG